MAKSRYARSRQHWKKERKTVHNQNKPFNPGKYGKVWGAIEFAHDWGRQPEGDANGPVIGKLKIGNQSVELTFTETNRIIETLRDAQHAHNVGVRLGRTNQDAGATLNMRRFKSF